MSSSITGSEKYNGGPRSSPVLSEFDTEYACSDHAMVSHVVQTAVRNYFSASCTNPTHMTICIDFTEGAPTPNNSTPTVRYQAPLVQINVERKFDPNVATAAATKDTKLSATASTTEKVDRGKMETRRENSLLNAAKKLSVFTIKEEKDEDVKPVKAVIEILKPKIPLQRVCNLKCDEKKIAEKKVFEYLPVIYKKFMSEEMFTEWRKKYDEDKRILYSDQQATAKDSSSSLVTACSNVSISFHDTGMITMDERTSGWEEAAGILGFDSPDNRGNTNKAVQIRGNLPNTL
ncbi:unnamed protein product [Acanthocheilonema viteae]|uniref:Uncharacterized protein n=1 Tax=Acanthocheilonema viteae TaxID=6277 RepID=A0A498SU66_ACAVI|nr:unnamed protein product [Acanthocheilonema viteae]